jgi:hypothetical protein
MDPTKKPQIDNERKKFPNKYPKKLRFEDSTIAESWIDKSKGFTLYKTDDVQQMNNLARFWLPNMLWTFLPLLSAPQKE